MVNDVESGIISTNTDKTYLCNGWKIFLWTNKKKFGKATKNFRKSKKKFWKSKSSVLAYHAWSLFRRLEKTSSLFGASVNASYLIKGALPNDARVSVFCNTVLLF